MAQAIPIGLAAGAGLIKGVGSIIGGKAESKALKEEARQLDAKAGTTRATSQRDAIEEARKARLLSSRAVAVAAASGGGVDDPTVLNILAGIEGEGEYRMNAALYGGEEEALGMEAAANARRREAKNVRKASKFSAAGSILGGASDAWDAATLNKKYG